MTSGSSDFRALICVTTCQRLALVRRYLPHYADLCQADPRFSLVVSLDGTEQRYFDFCEEWDVPLIYSEKREGVGLSKNRALKSFSDFDYFFFIEDDVELIDGSALPDHIELACTSGIHHFSLFAQGGLRKPIGDSVVAGMRVFHGMFGGGVFNFFTRESLERVGGWHPSFARYRRWGHTEHSYRVFRAGLAPAPFNVAQELANAFIWHSPPAITFPSRIELDEDQIPPLERKLMNEALDYVPVQTLSPFHFNGRPPGQVARLASTLAGGDRYPLVVGHERRESRSDLMLWRSETAATRAERLLSLLRAVAAWPRNPAIRHHLKTRLEAWRQARS